MAPRAFTRVPVHIHASFRPASGGSFQGVVRDLSLNGVSIESRHPVAVGTPCGITLLLGTGAEPIPVHARGTVVRASHGLVAAHIDEVAHDDYEHFTNLVLYNAPDAVAFEDEVSAHADQQPALRPVER